MSITLAHRFLSYICPVPDFYTKIPQSEIAYIPLGLVTDYIYIRLNTILMCWIKKNYLTIFKNEIAFHPRKYGILGNGLQG